MPFLPIIAMLLAFVAGPVVPTQPAVRVAPPVEVAPQPTYLQGEPCGEWWQLAQEVGWPPDQLPTMARVMRCESNCSPTAYNRSGASGLMQLMPMWWRGVGDPFDPVFNLTRALYVRQQQGWRAWSCY